MWWTCCRPYLRGSRRLLSLIAEVTGRMREQGKFCPKDSKGKVRAPACVLVKFIDKTVEVETLVRCRVWRGTGKRMLS